MHNASDLLNNIVYTQDEVKIPPGLYLVSRTDTTSAIQYVNEAFAIVSGFTRAELLGQPHNLVRHPDMPSIIFGDMWCAMKSGYAWRGIVKNRTKDGRFYWVKAQVAPIYRSNQLVGYASTRTAPTAAEVRDAHALYAKLKSGQISADTFMHKHSFKSKLKHDKRLALTCTTAAWAVPVCVSAGLLLDLTTAQKFWLAGVGSLAGITLAATLSGQVFKAMELLSGYLGIMAGKSDSCAKLPENMPRFGRTVLDKANQAWLNRVSLLQDLGRNLERGNKAVAELQQMSSKLSAQVGCTHGALNTVRAMSSDSINEAQSVLDYCGGTLNNVNDLVALTHHSTETIREVTARMEQMRKSLDEIAAFSDTIESIAFQTNLLALNAAVEAARAGEQGRGFAVVAQEVRTLAKRCADAAKGVQALAATNTACISESSELVDKANSAVHSIEKKTEDIAVVGKQILDINHHQLQHLTRLNASLEEIVRNAEVAAEVASGCQQLGNSLSSRNKRLAEAAS